MRKSNFIALGKELFTKNRNFILYGIIGFSGVFIDYGVFYTLYNFAGSEALVSNIISVSFGISNNFVLNSQFNFKKKDQIFKRFVLFYAVGIGGLILSNIILLIFHSGIGLNANLVKLISIPFVVSLQYLLNKKIAFK